jgi:hypothetical protein
MNAVLSKLNDIVEEAEKVLVGLKKRKEEVDFSHELLSKGHEELKAKTVDIAQREAVIAPVENFNALKKQNEEKAAGLQAELSDLDAKKKSFESYKASELERIENIRLLASKENDNVVAGFQRLAEKEKNIEEEVKKRVDEIVFKLRK